MNPDKWLDIISLLRARGINFAEGLKDAEVLGLEKKFGFRFPPDLRALLQTAVPKGKQFPDWHSGSEIELRDWLDTPRRGIFFDIERNNFWLTEWGPKPPSIQEALDRADALLAAAPKLIPIFAHRMMPDDPSSEGNPVYSVHQTDIIYYGYDLEDYLRHEFDLPGRKTWPEEIRSIRFWNIERFQEVRWSAGPCEFDNRRGILPQG